MSPSSPQNVDQESGHYTKQSLKSKTLDPLTTSFRKLFRGKIQSKPSSKPVIPQDSSANIGLCGEIEHPDLVSQSLPSNSRAIEQSIGATFQDAHHFSIGGNARIVTIGQQNVINRGTYGLDTLEKFVSFSALHDSSAQDPERCCHPGTRKGVLDQMRKWADDPSRPERILWLHGPAGVGKSAIAQTISYSYGRDKIGATFFFFRSDPIRNDGNRLFPTLAWQLALSVPTTKDLITSSLEDYPDLPRKAIEAQFDRLIVQPFLTISGDESASPTSIRVIIIDGLDECSDVKLQQRILKLIGNAIANPRFPLRFVISSRTEAHIEDFFAQFQYPTLQIDLANVDEAYRDIETYLKFEFGRIAVEQELDPVVWPGQRIIDILISQSSGQFVYASTTIKYVGDEYESAVTQLHIILGLKLCTRTSPFADLDALYKEILQRQPDQDFLREFLPVLIARSMLVGISIGNLDDAMVLGINEKELRRKLRGMHSLLKFEPFMNVHHKSFLDFIDDPLRSGEYHLSKHFANRRYMQLITDELVKAASNAIEQTDFHEHNHFKPRFATVIQDSPLPVKLPLDDLENILRPLLIIQERLLQLPNMSVPWKPRACEECWTFYMIDDLLLHLTMLRGTAQSHEPKYVGLRPLTAIEERKSIPQLDLDACLSLLLANLRGVESQVSLNVHTIGLMHALVRFDPTETAMKIRSMTDAENLVELIFCLNKNQCFNSCSGAAAHNATRLAVAIYGRVPVLPRSFFLNGAGLARDKGTYQGIAVRIWGSALSIRRGCFDAFMWGNLSHRNMTPLLGMCSDLTDNWAISLSQENVTLLEWRQSTHPSVSQIQQIVFEIARAIQYVHSLDIFFGFGCFPVLSNFLARLM
ncbi:hypothetical protein M378DRAFT_174158 [Amanita muscaria Koide BX008]|uniref:NACHT domain-containing protein n=1 Tax=Amanita muscaria (strain Koide BX008) TaxID=946122 RepID=A0A0C2WET1_AMAMK|nr:hypothetical protein M378DRAFT_174158 [Amanita muscaria Koide BX008]